MSRIDAKKVTEDYIFKNHWNVKENSTINFGIGGLILKQSEVIVKDYWLNELYDRDIRDAHEDKFIHIHDLGFLGAYCMGWSLLDLIKKGLTGVEGKCSSAPANHLSTLCNQMVNFIGIMSQESAGAQAFSSVDTYLSAFIKHENLSYKETKQCVQNLVFGLNFSARWGSQPPFSNFTLDWTVPEDLKLQNAIVGGKELDFTYGDCQLEMDMFNKAFMEVIIEGDANSRGHIYPIPTYSITKDFDWSKTKENNKLLFEMTAKYGIPYFGNYVNSDMEPSDVRSMCCRLRLDLRELKKRNGGFFGAGENTGSIGVVTLNLPKISFLSKDEDEFFKLLEKYMNISQKSLEIKRKTVNKYMDMGLYPYTKVYLGSLNSHFSTLGLVGGNEMCLNAKWIKKDMSNIEAQNFSEKVLDFMRDKLADYQEKTGNLYNLEATPSEASNYRFAKYDKEKYKSIITAGKEGETPYYTNSTNLPVGITDDVFEVLDIQDKLQVKYTSGTVVHTYLGERLTDWETCMNLVKKISDNYKLPYYSISPTYSICSTHGYINGEEFTCPNCGKETEVYSRITGYYRPLKNWNDGKQQEYKDRKEYII